MNLDKQKISNIRRFYFTVVIPALLLWAQSSVGESRFQSTVQALSVIELYTSEGCYSCPPADRWLSALKNHAGLFTEFVPLSFHVDYWNDLGWRDTYSRAEFSQRQRRYHQLGQVSGVYTPGMFVGGYEWRLWRNRENGRFNQRRTNDPLQVGALTLDYTRGDARVRFNPNTKDLRPARAYVALLGVGIEAPIPAGENKGETLHHDFVVLDLQDAKLEKKSDGTFVATLPTLHSNLIAPTYAVATWITNDRDNKPLQATGGWIVEP